MAELSSIKLKPEEHLLLDQPLLRLPYESSRSTFKTAQRNIEQTQSKVEDSIKSAIKSAGSGAPDGGAKSVASLNQAITRLETLKRKLASLDETQQTLSEHNGARIEHLQELYSIPTLADVKYDQWSKVRLDRLLVDYMLRKGYLRSAKELAAERKIEALADTDVFEAAFRIERSLRVDRRVDLALQWCAENKQNLKKLPDNHFERELRLQQLIEMIRAGPDKIVDATMHARKYLTLGPSQVPFALLSYGPDVKDEAMTMYFDPGAWDKLAQMFIKTHHALLSIPHSPLLHIALAAGLSALKTPACHSKYISPTSGVVDSAASASKRTGAHQHQHHPLRHAAAASAQHHHGTSASDNNSSNSEGMTTDPVSAPSLAAAAMLNTPMCPICSTELNKLAEPLPFAHHNKSHVENDPVVLPNGRIYGRERLWKLNEKLGTPKGKVRDPSEPSKMFSAEHVRKVFIM